MEKKDLKGQLEAKATAVSAPDKKEPTLQETVWGWLKSQEKNIAAALPKHMSTDRLVRIIWTSLRLNPKLMTCSRDSLIAAVMQSAQLGLEPGLLGQCYLIPYWNGKKKIQEVQFQIGYRGLIDLARRTGELKSLFAEVVCENDQFDMEMGTNRYLKHVPLWDKERGKRRGVYAVAQFKDGTYEFVAIPMAEIERIRDTYSKSKDDGPWANEFDEMAKKTAIKRLMKVMPMSVELARQFAQDETVKTEIGPDMADILPVDAVSNDALGGEPKSEVIEATGTVVDENAPMEGQTTLFENVST